MTILLPAYVEMLSEMGRPAEDWAGNCHGASRALAKLLGPEEATVRRGYFIGETKPGAFFHGRPSQHSWVELRDGRVADPTRFAFVGGPAWPPWVGPGDDYDIGGCRTTAPRGTPPDPYETERPPTEINLMAVDYIATLLGSPSHDYGFDDDTGEGWIMVTNEQAIWLANLPIKDREEQGQLARWYAAEVYEALCDAGFSGFIPIDRRDWILPERSEGRSSF